MTQQGQSQWLNIYKIDYMLILQVIPACLSQLNYTFRNAQSIMIYPTNTTPLTLLSWFSIFIMPIRALLCVFEMYSKPAPLVYWTSDSLYLQTYVSRQRSRHCFPETKQVFQTLLQIWTLCINNAKNITQPYDYFIL